MRALVLTKYGAPEVLRIEERPTPEPLAGEVLVRVHAAGVNFADLQARVGLYPEAPKPPSVVGYEVSGIVEAIGAGVDRSLVGARVMAPTRFGGYAEYAIAKARDLVPMADTMSFVDAASLPVVAGTAYEALVKQGNVDEGEICIIHAAAGGVGLAAVQIAKSRGARVIGTASKAKHAALRDFGVDFTIDYTSEDVAGRVRHFTGGKGVDVILDSRGGSAFRESYGLLRAGGRLVVYGANAMAIGNTRDLFAAAKTLVTSPRFGSIPLMQESKSVCGVNLLRIWDEHGSLERVSRPITRLLRDRVLKPVVSATFSLEDGPKAHQFIHDRKNVGKVVLVVRP